MKKVAVAPLAAASEGPEGVVGVQAEAEACPLVCNRLARIDRHEA